jgi:Fe-Mn family superoxide dismutase
MTHVNLAHLGLSSSTLATINRRNFLKTAGGAALAATAAGIWATAASAKNPAPVVIYALPPLPYAFDALEPTIDATTMEIHHDKHHQAYVTNLNKALEGTGIGAPPINKLIAGLDKVPEEIRTAVRNNGGGHANHSLFWQLLAKDGGEPTGDVKAAIDSQLGGYDKFKEDFKKAALTRFGSGWAWVSVDKDKKLIIESTPNQDSPIMAGNSPILGIDVWEHAYYLKYQNRRPEYVDAFFSVINWPKVAELYSAATKA